MICRLSLALPFILILLLLLGACDDGGPKGRVLNDVPPHLEDGNLISFLLTDPQAQSVDGTVAEALAERGITVVLSVRPEALPWETHLVAIKEKIRQLWARGVRQNHISVVGRGGNGLQALVLASLVRDGATRYAVMGACPRNTGVGWSRFAEILDLNGPRMEGQALSLTHADSPDIGSCQPVFNRASALEGWETDLADHAGTDIFEKPDPVWIDEVVAWITEK